MTVLYPAIEPYDQGMLDVGDGNLVDWEFRRTVRRTVHETAVDSSSDVE